MASSRGMFDTREMMLGEIREQNERMLYEMKQQAAAAQAAQSQGQKASIFGLARAKTEGSAIEYDGPRKKSFKEQLQSDVDDWLRGIDIGGN